jgi:hypothetical protein
VNGVVATVIAISSGTTTALIAAGAALGGALIGGLIPAWTTDHIEHRRDKADVRQARRLVLEELRSVWNHADGLVRTSRFPIALLPPSPRFLPDEQWQANRAILARHLPDNEWDALSPFMDSIPATRAIVEGAPPSAAIPDELRDGFLRTRELAAEVYSFLSGGGDVAG